jgi:hypothetical protein
VAAGSEEVLGLGREGCRVLDDLGRDELFRATGAVAQAAVAGMRTGLIAPHPERRCPLWCRLGPACRARRGGYRP